MCASCLAKVRRLRAGRRAPWKYDVLASAVVWADEAVDLCPACSRVYDAVRNVRTQLITGERPSAESLATFEQFRFQCPRWPGFRRRALTAAQREAAREGRGGRAAGEELHDAD